MTYRLNLVFFLFFAPGYAICSNGNVLNTYEHLLDNYKTYSLARSITNNYKKMGIDFNKLPLKDYTMGFMVMLPTY